MARPITGALLGAVLCSCAASAVVPGPQHDYPQAATTRAPESTAMERVAFEFPAPLYEQGVMIRFASEEAARRADIRFARLFDGYDRAISCRWDDNFDGTVAVNALHTARGLQSTWYLNGNGVQQAATDFVPTARVLTANGSSIGGHGLTHPYITWTNRNAMFREMAEVRIEWEAALDTFVHSYAFSFVDYRSKAEPDASQHAIIRCLERAGYYHVTTNVHFHQAMPNDLLLSPILPPENMPFDVWEQGLEWMLSDPVMVREYPMISNSMHAWYGTPLSQYGLDELERRLDRMLQVPDAWRTNHNAYAAYMLQVREGSAAVSGRAGTELYVRVERPLPDVLNDPVPVTLEVLGVDPGDIDGIEVDGRAAEVSGRSQPGRVLVNLAHGHQNPLAARIDRLGNPDNGEVLAESAAFPGLAGRVRMDGGALSLVIENNSPHAVTDARVTWRLPLMWREGIHRQALGDVPAGGRVESTLAPTAATDDPLVTGGDQYYVAQVDFMHGGVAGRLHLDCAVAGGFGEEFPRGRFQVLGPLDPERFDVAAFGESVSAGRIPATVAWGLGGPVGWRVAPVDGPVDDGILSPEVIRTTGDWFPVNTPPFALAAEVTVPTERALRIDAIPADTPGMWLDGRPVEPGSVADFRAGANQLVFVHRNFPFEGQGGRHMAAFLRLVNPATGERDRDVRYAPGQPLGQE